MLQRCQPRALYVNLVLRGATSTCTAQGESKNIPLCSSPRKYRNLDSRRSFAYDELNDHGDHADNFCPSLIRGIDFVRDPKLNKGMAFTLKERMTLGIHGLIPPAFKNQADQVKLCKANVDMYQEDIQKYIYLTALQDRNERLFYQLLSENVKEFIPLIYTPTVGVACQKFGLIYRRPRGLFITIHDKGHVYEILKNWPEHNIRAIVVTDGERILGLGDLGAYGMGIPVGKMSLYTGLAGIKPNQCLPICLDVGTDTQRLLDDPFYIGLRQKRVRGKDYDDLVEEFMSAVARLYGQLTLVQFEDFGIDNAFRLLDKYRDRYCTFNDDIQGTAAVAVAGILSSLRVTKGKFTDQRLLFMGAGGAALGIASLLCKALEKEGLSTEEAASRIFMMDVNGLLVKGRTDMSPQQVIFAKDAKQFRDFYDMVEFAKPTIIIGASAQSGAFTERVLRKMGELNKRPVIFALSNPTSKAECTAEAAYKFTDGRAVFVSGSPFPDYNHNGKIIKPGQGNNAYIFPGVALGVLAAGMRHISDDVFLLAARVLADTVSEADLEHGRLYPDLQTIIDISRKIAEAIAVEAYKNGTASTYPEPASKAALIKSELYDFTYPKTLPAVYNWPGHVEIE